MEHQFDKFTAWHELNNALLQASAVHNSLQVLAECDVDFVRLMGGWFIEREMELTAACVVWGRKIVAMRKILGQYNPKDEVAIKLLEDNLASIKTYFNPQLN